MKYFLTICILLASLGSWAQDKLLNVDVGDETPDIILYDIQDRTEPTVELRNLSNEKLVILDFWATWCGACLAAMPKMDSIARERSDEIEVITVTKQDKELVMNFFEKRKQRGDYVHKSPKLFGDTVLNKHFPHRFIPHYVWMKDGKVIALTEEVTRAAVQQALSEGETKLRKKVDTKAIPWNKNEKSLLQHLQNINSLDMSAWKHYSLLTTGFLEKVGPHIGYTQVHMDSLNLIRFTGVHMALARLYRIAYGRARWYITNTAVEIRSESSFFANQGLKGMRVVDWLRDYGVSYESVVSRETDIFVKMASDLKEAFPQFRAYTEKTKDTCLVLEVFKEKPEKPWKVFNDEKPKYISDMDCISVENGTVRGFMTSLETTVFLNSKFPLVDGIGYPDKISVSICGRLGSLAAINEALAPYGLRITKKLAWFDKLIIEDNE
ncbi:TlpA family protein disulfide reductase [Sphingobacterium gobiense]|uniref:Thioredoxin domain-containing protein n=1 Tax=Sphingobacterium gobiense TaxID=1382456 RepID=A0A2S9JNK8_9SPHI|nr:TlpA disulfide reductase family protein [Sphingobacterium gobiense]PRD54702.1 hypothetical protein C5749_14815 [Sphingobacterium gobiense]